MSEQGLLQADPLGVVAELVGRRALAARSVRRRASNCPAVRRAVRDL